MLCHCLLVLVRIADVLEITQDDEWEAMALHAALTPLSMHAWQIMNGFGGGGCFDMYRCETPTYRPHTAHMPPVGVKVVF